MASRQQVMLDLSALIQRKPTAAPLVEPGEAVAIALSMLRWAPGRLHGPDDRTVTLVLKSLDLAGWKIVPK